MLREYRYFPYGDRQLRESVCESAGCCCSHTDHVMCRGGEAYNVCLGTRYRIPVTRYVYT